MKEQTRFQTEIRTIHRSEIKNAPYNPRVISDKAFKKLKDNLKKRGLMSTLTWNETTGNLVSGHQRLKALDMLESKSEGDYMLSVSVVRLTGKEEREQNIFFNSTTVQGEFDLEALADILFDIDAFAAGLDENDLNILGLTQVAESFGTDEQEQSADLLAQMKADKKAKVKAAKEASRERIDDKYQEGETYVTISFSTFAAKKAFMLKMGLHPDDLFIKGELFTKNVKYAPS